MTIFQILKADHKTVSSLLKNLEKTTAERAAQREKLFAQFEREMSAHSKAEEEAVYMKLKGREETKDLVLQALEEHALVDHLITQLLSLDKSDETWIAKLIVLKDMIEHHVEIEESEMFKLMRKELDSSELKEMAREMSELKNRRIAMAA